MTDDMKEGRAAAVSVVGDRVEVTDDKEVLMVLAREVRDDKEVLTVVVGEVLDGREVIIFVAGEVMSGESGSGVLDDEHEGTVVPGAVVGDEVMDGRVVAGAVVGEKDEMLDSGRMALLVVTGELAVTEVDDGNEDVRVDTPALEHLGCGDE